ncbi:MAG: ATP-binding protein [Pseudomonadota bacterium]
MTVTALESVDLSVEWDRIALLADRLELLRQGKPLSDEAMARLADLQKRTEILRTAGGWAGLATDGLDGIERDILAAALASQAAPKIAWQYQRLQPGQAEPYPTLALLQDLLLLENAECDALFHALRAGGPLVQRRLIAIEGEGPFRIAMPGPGTAEKLFGRANRHGPPPGTVPVTTRGQWDDLVLPKEQVERLRELLVLLRHKQTVVDDWGGQNTGGPVALFAGPSGTGKTFAASIIAAALDWPLFRLDLGMVVSKYIGETEKNLNRLLDTLHGAEAILQIDEVDALLSKRGEVKEARDRYANMEVSHLLSRIELHDGPVILTTNLRRELDQAFVRRFHIVVDFPRPDAASRCTLWQRLLPPQAPLAKDLDFDELGRAANLSGGSIRNAALHAAYLAADRGGPIGKKEAALAMWRELNKENRQVARSELGVMADHLPRGIG